MATTSNKSVAARLGLRPGRSLFAINPPPHWKTALGQLPSGASAVGKSATPADRVVVFAGSNAELEKLLEPAMEATKTDGALWVAYPKKETKRSDLSRESVHTALRLAGWTPVGVISIDDVWTAIRGRPATESERRGI